MPLETHRTPEGNQGQIKNSYFELTLFHKEYSLTLTKYGKLKLYDLRGGFLVEYPIARKNPNSKKFQGVKNPLKFRGFRFGLKNLQYQLPGWGFFISGPLKI